VDMGPLPLWSPTTIQSLNYIVKHEYSIVSQLVSNDETVM